MIHLRIKNVYIPKVRAAEETIHYNVKVSINEATLIM